MTRNILENIGSYKNEMTISQVVRFFEGFGMSFTKTMIQNYVRVGVIPPPIRQRYYVKNHLILLAITYGLKESYSLPEITKLFKLYIKTGKDNEPVIMYETYRALWEKYYNTTSLENILDLMVQTTVNKKIVKNMLDNEDL